MRLLLFVFVSAGFLLSMPLTAHAATAGAYVGCYKDPGEPRALDGASIPKWDRVDQQTPAWCVGECRGRGFSFAGWQNNWCFCGNNPDKYGRLDDSACSDKLAGPVASNDPGNPPATAGGPGSVSVYAVHGTAPPAGQPGTSQRPGTGGLKPTYLGCFRDQGDPHGLADRDINGFVMNLDTMTTETCISECRTRGYPYAGTQYGRWCFCGDSYAGSGAADNCNMTCSGNPQQICGGAWANSVFSTGLGTSPVRPAQTYSSPSIGSNRLDWCREWAKNCGQPAADAWCKAAGFSRASNFQGPDMAPNTTQIISTGQFCEGDFCGGFYSITCQ